MSKLNLRCSASQARPSPKSDAGTRGGVATLVRNHIAVSPLAESGEQCGPLGHGLDWSAIVVQLRGAPLLIVSIYLTDTIGITGENVQKLMQ
eukprot:3981046-Alexandrium_andersonii.AAC.1